MSLCFSHHVGWLPSVAACARACGRAGVADWALSSAGRPSLVTRQASRLCMNRYLIHWSLISGPARSAHFLPMSCGTADGTWPFSHATSITMVNRGQCQSSCCSFEMPKIARECLFCTITVQVGWWTDGGQNLRRSMKQFVCEEGLWYLSCTAAAHFIILGKVP